MVSIYRPAWDNLEGLLGAATDRVLVCSPYITRRGIDFLFQALPGHVGLKLITRLSPSDWACGVSDPEAIMTLLEVWDGDGNPTSLQVVQRLHAKVYSADESQVIVGSSNLSDGGFDHNIELVVELSGDAGRDAVQALNAACSPHLRNISIGQLRGWIERSRDTVATASKAADQEPDALSDVQADLDKMLKFGTASSLPGLVAISDLDTFVSWLNANRNLPGAQVILDRHYNSHGQNLTGHVKQCFFGSFRFLREHPHMVDPTSNALAGLSVDEVYQVTYPGLQEGWADHLDAHALDQSDSYSYPTLRGILPPSFGGTLLGGGGGISTLKRMLPLVARCISVDAV